MFRLLGILITVLFAIGSAVLVWPQFFRLEQTFPFAQLVASRGGVAVGFAVIASLALLLLFVRSLRGFAASILIVALAGAAVSAAIGFSRGFRSDTLPEKTTDSLRVMAWNTDGEAVPAEEVARQIVDEQVDIAALPETSVAVGTRIAEILRDMGHPMWVHHVNSRPEVSRGPQAWQTTVLISPTLGDYSVIESSIDGSSNTGSVPSAVVMPVDGNGPTIVAVHAVAPRPDDMNTWRSDLRWVADQCPEGDVIMAGDFNSTVDHGARLGMDGGDLGRCFDAGSRAGVGASGTFPGDWPTLIGTPIDRVLASANWTATGAKVLDAAGSDHRGLIVQLEPTP